MLKHQLIHPKINEVLARAGHHAKILIADGNYPASTKKGPNAEIVCLNLAPGVVTCAQALQAILSASPVDCVNTMGIPPEKATAKFPAHEQFGLTSQLRRAAVSIGSNIAEGFSRQGAKEKIQFYSIAKGSVVETQSQLLLARDIGYLDNETYELLANSSVRVHKLVNGLISSIKKWSLPNTKYEKPAALRKSEIL